MTGRFDGLARYRNREPSSKPAEGAAAPHRAARLPVRHTTPNASIASATFLKPAMFAPFT